MGSYELPKLCAKGLCVVSQGSGQTTIIQIIPSLTLNNLTLKPNTKGVFIIYTRGWYRREMGWVSHFFGV